MDQTDFIIVCFFVVGLIPLVGSAIYFILNPNMAGPIEYAVPGWLNPSIIVGLISWLLCGLLALKKE